MKTEYIKKLLIALEEEIILNESEISRALFLDLGKSQEEAIMTEIGMVLKELRSMIKNLKSYRKPKRVRNTILNFRSKSFIYPEPWGHVLIVSPWNYPFNLSMIPLIGAIAAGNTVTLKTSSKSINTSRVIKKIVENVFPNYICRVIFGGNSNEEVLGTKFDYIFFTGGLETGRLFYEKAARDMVPVTLELGGKSPAFVLDSADLDLTARRIAFGKFLNAGQTCVAVDYCMCPRGMERELRLNILKYIRDFYGYDPIISRNLGKIISKNDYMRLVETLEREDVKFKRDDRKLKIEPTVVITDLNSPLMSREIFGPILPIIPYDYKEKALEYIENQKTPLAFYIFGSEKEAMEIAGRMKFGGASINDTMSHMVGELPFGGMGESGIGAYHGEYTFKTFVHEKSVLVKKKWPDFKMRYPGKSSAELLKKLFRIK